MRKLVNLFRRSRRERLESELDRELHYHLERRIEELRHSGLTDVEAKRQAAIDLGGIAKIQEDVRDTWYPTWLNNLIRDLRFSLRLMSNKPGFTLTAVLALALGIGPNTALFSVIYAAAFESTGYPQADHLVQGFYQPKSGKSRHPLAAGDFLQYQRESTVFESFSTSKTGFALYEGAHGTEQVRTQATTHGYITKTAKFDLILGRDFLPEEFQSGSANVVILGHAFWKTRFAAEPGVIGRTMVLSRQVYTIIGVMSPRRASEPFQIQIWKPLVFSAAEQNNRGLGDYSILARLRPGTSITTAQTEMDRIQANPAGYAITLQPVRGEWAASDTRNAIWLLGGGVSFVLLIACANLSSLMLAQGTARQREVAIRMSLGATRARLITQFLTESLVVSAMGCIGGGVLGWSLVRVLVAQLPAVTLLAETEPTLNLPVLLFTAGIALFAGTLFGSVPVWKAASLSLGASLKRSSLLRLRRVLIVAECAAAMTLLAGAAICVHSFWQRTTAELGVKQPDRILTFEFGMPAGVQGNHERIDTYYQSVLSAIRSVPGVQLATASAGAPLASHPRFPFGRESDRVGILHLMENYFETYGIPIVRGREFDNKDRNATEPVTMINQEFARIHYPNQDPLGQYLEMSLPSAKGMVPIQRRIVGIFHNVKSTGTLNLIEPEIAVPATQGFSVAATIAVRSSVDPTSLRDQIAKTLQQVAPTVAMRDAMTLDQMAANVVKREQGYAIVFSMLAALGLLLSGLGIYGVMAFLVAQRTKEIGVRMALGADRRQVMHSILREGLTLALVGLTIGAAAAAIAGSRLQSAINETQQLNYTALAAAAVVLILCAAGACLAPALRASQVDPVDSLRAE